MNMKSFYLSGSFAGHSEHNGISSRMACWIARKFADHRARRIKLQSVRYLRSLEGATLDDIGLDVRVLNSPFALNSPSSNYVIDLAKGGGTSRINV